MENDPVELLYDAAQRKIVQQYNCPECLAVAFATQPVEINCKKCRTTYCEADWS